MSVEWPDEIVGAREFTAWLERTTTFHDAYVRDFHVSKSGDVELTLRGFRMTTALDGRGHFVLDKHYIATIALEGVRSIELEGFEDGAAILDILVFAKTAAGDIRTTIESSIGMTGEVISAYAKLSFRPVVDAGVWPPAELE